MARIPDAELERPKREVSLVPLISQGTDLACRCPWHEGDARDLAALSGAFPLSPPLRAVPSRALASEKSSQSPSGRTAQSLDVRKAPPVR